MCSAWSACSAASSLQVFRHVRGVSLQICLDPVLDETVSLHVFSMGSEVQAHLQTCVNIQLQTGGVRKSRPFLNNQLDSQLARLQARGGQEVPTLFEESAWVQCSQLACVYLQLQTVGVRKSDPF